ncbi:hypothetical protein [Tatumella morbirosei]|nr:hypothetical protein [Tatumella morbirosei]
MKKLRILSAAAIVFALAGCNSEPSETEITQAVQKNIDQANAQVQKMAGSAIQTDGFMTKLHSLRKISCDQTGKGEQYNCKVEVDITAPFVGERKTVSQISLVKDNDGWDVVQ